MKLPLTRRKVQYWALLAVLLLSARSQLWAQTSSSAYFPLVTARNVAVYDTLSGLNMSVLKISPQVKHGAVQINILSAGGNGLWYSQHQQSKNHLYPWDWLYRPRAPALCCMRFHQLLQNRAGHHRRSSQPGTPK